MSAKASFKLFARIAICCKCCLTQAEIFLLLKDSFALASKLTSGSIADMSPLLQLAAAFASAFFTRGRIRLHVMYTVPDPLFVQQSAIALHKRTSSRMRRKAKPL
eukprot:18051-Heterococcus_DN1.PRE.3